MTDYNSPLVYSTDRGRICPDCGRESEACLCKKKPAGLKGTGGPVRIRREKKGRKGKTVTLISGAPGHPAKVAAELKRFCGSGGSVKDGEILIQGDQRQKVTKYFQEKGCRVQLSGG